MNSGGTGSHVLAVVAHPDDEVLGAGGALARHAAKGDTVHIAFLADGIGSRGEDREAGDRRAVAAKRAAEILGARPPRFLGFQDNRLDGVDLLDVVKAVEAVVSEILPATIYTHHLGDLNVDHEICSRAVLTACRPLPGFCVRRIYAFEVASSTEWSQPNAALAFVPNRFVDISAALATKRRALEAYQEEMRDFPHPRSYQAVEALAAWRGASAGFHAAEAFMVLRDIES